MRRIPFIVICLGLGLATTVHAAWFWPYAYRQTLTIAGSQVPNTNQSDFPVLITETSINTALFGHTQRTTPADIDIVFTAADGTTELNREVVVFNEGGQKLEAWVKIPTLTAGADTVIYMYYGASASRSNDTATWSNGFAGVWHMQESAGDVLDSTASAASGTRVGSPTAAAAVISQGQTTSDNNCFDVGIPSKLNMTGLMTVEAWANCSNLATDEQGIVTRGLFRYGLEKYKDGINQRFGFYIYNTTVLWAEALSAPVVAGTWYHAVGRWDATGEVDLFMNGTKQTTTASAAFIDANASNDHKVGFGRIFDNTDHDLAGGIDEVRICNTDRSDDWIHTEYHNQSNPAGFCSSTGEEAYVTPSVTPVDTDTATPQDTPSITSTATLADTFTSSPTGTPTSSATPTPTAMDTHTVSPTSTISETSTCTPPLTPTITPSVTQTPTITPTATITRTTTVTPTSTSSPTPAPATSLFRVVVYPNPCQLIKQQRPLVVFRNLPPQVVIRLYDLSGVRVQEIRKDDTSGVAVWDLRNTSGQPVASGVYIYIIKSPIDEARGKIVILR